jgi:hypothetical protein
VKARARSVLMRAVSVHLAMGFGLGTFLALALIAGDTRNIFDAIVQSPAPALALAVFVGLFGAMVGVGAALTGLIFTLMDER